MKELKNFIRISEQILDDYISEKEKDFDRDNVYPGCRVRDYVVEEIELDNPCDDIYYRLTENEDFVKAFRALLEAL